MSHPDDETLNAVLDGETGPEERAHVEGCAACGGRLEQLRRAAALTATPVPAVDELRREAAIRGALALHDGRRATRPRPPAWAWSAVAAAAVVLVGAIALGQSGGGDQVASPGTATEADADALATAGEAGGGDASAGATESAPAADESITMAAPPGQLGELRGADLTAVLGPHLEPGQPVAEEGTVPCDTEARRDLTEDSALIFSGSGTYDGEPVTVVVFEAPDGQRTARLLDAGCGLVLSQAV